MKQIINQYSCFKLFRKLLIAMVCNICYNQVLSYDIEDVYLHGIEKANKGHADLPNSVSLETFFGTKDCEQRGENSRVLFEERDSMDPKLLPENGSSHPDVLPLNVDPLKYGKVLHADTSDKVHIACLTANKTGTFIRQSRRQRQHNHHHNTPRVTMVTESHCVEKDTFVTLTCTVDSRLGMMPNVSYLQPRYVKWVQNTSMLIDSKLFNESTTQVQMGQWKSELTIEKMSYEHEGRYMCVVIFRGEWMSSEAVYLAISRQRYGPESKLGTLDYPKWPQPSITRPMKTIYTVEVNSIYGIFISLHPSQMHEVDLQVEGNKFIYGGFYEIEVTCFSSLGLHRLFSNTFYCPSHRMNVSFSFTNIDTNRLFIDYYAIPKLDSSAMNTSSLHQYSEGLSGVITPPVSLHGKTYRGKNVTHKATISIPQGHFVNIMVKQQPRPCGKCDIKLLNGLDITAINGSKVWEYWYQYGTNTSSCDIEVVATCTYTNCYRGNEMLYYITWEEIHVYGHGHGQGHGLLKKSEKGPLDGVVGLGCITWLLFSQIIWAMITGGLPKIKIIRICRYPYDVFVSYHHDDIKFAYDLVCKIEGWGLTTHVADRDFIPGKYIAENITNAIYSSRRTILIVSQKFLKSNWCKLEFRLAVQAATESHLDRVILIRLDKCQIPNEMKLIQTYLDHYDRRFRKHFDKRLMSALIGPEKTDAEILNGVITTWFHELYLRIFQPN